MVSTETLTSLAMLKVNIDGGRDYLDYLQPFIMQVLADHKPEPVTDEIVCNLIQTQFGLVIPQRTVHIILKRLSRKNILTRNYGVYQVQSQIPDPGITAKKSDATRHIQAVISGLLEFAKDNGHDSVIGNDDDAVTAVCSFLSEFNISCLRAYLRDTTIPTIEGKEPVQNILISQYVLHLQKSDPERFESFLIVLQGHMLANALLCPDLKYATKTYRGVTFYLDTPLLVPLLGLEGSQKKDAVEGLLALLRELGATLATFTHCRDELDRVIRAAASNIDSPNGRRGIVMEARRNNITKSDLILIAEKIEQLLAEARVRLDTTPPYNKKFQIDETIFEQVIDDEYSYSNTNAKETDINSVRSIYVMRANTVPSSIEKCKAIFVTSNAAFARAAYEYGRQYEESREVSSVITDFSLANLAWLKAPMGAPSLPRKELLAYSYAALQPSKAFLDKVLIEIDKLQARGTISVADHQLLRSSPLVQDELMELTLGQEVALTAETLTEALNRASNEIKKEESDKHRQEQEAHEETRRELDVVRSANDAVRERMYWRCVRNAKRWALLFSGAIGTLLLIGTAVGYGLRSTHPIGGLLILIGSPVSLIFGLANLYWGTSVIAFHQDVEIKILKFLLQREELQTGLTLSHENEDVT